MTNFIITSQHLKTTQCYLSLTLFPAFVVFLVIIIPPALAVDLDSDRRSMSSSQEAAISSTCMESQSSNDDQSSCTNQGSSTNPAAASGIPEPGVILGRSIRSPLARAVYFKQKEDEMYKNDRHVYWYRVIVSRLREELQGKFVQFDQDEEADAFLANCQEKSDSIFLQLYHSIARPILNMFMTQTSINGLLNRGSMFIFSKSQFEKLMNYSPYHKGSALLDLGAGDGMVTQQMSSYFNTTYATEMSSVMVRRLSGLGFQVLGVDEWPRSSLKFDLVSCLNLLDRCERPLTLLSEVKTVLKPVTGRLLVAVVIPFKPYVEFDSESHEPSELLRVTGPNFEEQIQQFTTIFHQAGFVVEKFTRLPYLCEGDLRHSFYVLSDALFVLKVAEVTSHS